MDGNLLLANIQLAIAANGSLLTWCADHGMTAPTVMIGIDLDDLPDESGYPLVVISRAGKKGGRGLEQEEFVFVIGCGIFDDSVAVGSGSKKTFQQIYDLESYRQLVIHAMGSADLDGGYIAEIEIEYQPIDTFPFFVTNMEVLIVRPYAFREDWLI